MVPLTEDGLYVCKKLLRVPDQNEPVRIFEKYRQKTQADAGHGNSIVSGYASF